MREGTCDILSLFITETIVHRQGGWNTREEVCIQLLADDDEVRQVGFADTGDEWRCQINV